MAVTSRLGLTLLGADRRQPEVIVDANMQILDAAVSGNASGAIWARVYHNANQSIANNTVTALAFNSERYDTNVIHDNTTNNSRLTCKTAGVYHITLSASFDANATGVRAFYIRLNGTVANYIALAHLQAVTVASTSTAVTISATYGLAVNDYVEAVVFQSCGGALNILATPPYSAEFMMIRLGA